MNDKDLFSRSIDLLKRELIARYVYLMLIVIGVYSLIFYFIVGDKLFSYYTCGYFFILSYTWLLVRKNYSIERLVHLHMITGPLFASFIMLNLWKYSIGCSMWLLPVPIGAYVFFERKYIYLYALYVVIIILIINFLTHTFDFNYFAFKDKNQIRISDTFVFVANIIVVSLLLYYKDKIRKIEIDQKYNRKRNSLENFVPNNAMSSDENVDKYNLLFNKIKEIVEDDSSYKDSDFTISRLSSMLNTNTSYISKAIRMNGYSSFTHYLNFCKVNHVKQLIQENDLNKITLMYIYTASGFSNQSTFNRVFKQIEGVTPSEYIQNL